MRTYTDKIKFFIKYLFVLRGILTTRGDGDFSFLCPRSPTPGQTQSPPRLPARAKTAGVFARLRPGTPSPPNPIFSLTSHLSLDSTLLFHSKDSGCVISVAESEQNIRQIFRLHFIVYFRLQIQRDGLHWQCLSPRRGIRRSDQGR